MVEMKKIPVITWLLLFSGVLFLVAGYFLIRKHTAPETEDIEPETEDLEPEPIPEPEPEPEPEDKTIIDGAK
jgi:hypothetical protein